MGLKVQFAANFAHFPRDVPCYVIAPNQLFMSYDLILSNFAYSKNEHSLKADLAIHNTDDVTINLEKSYVFGKPFFWVAIFISSTLANRSHASRIWSHRRNRSLRP